MKYILFAIIFAFSLISYSQTDTSSKLKVFIDCNNCDKEYIKQEITYIEYVRDRLLSDVQIQIVTENTGSGGKRQTFCFIGQSEFEGISDTLRINFEPNMSPDETRQRQLKAIQVGLAPFLIRKGFINDINYSVNIPEGNNEQEKDKWNNWVFNISGNGWFNGEAQYNSSNLNGFIDISRVTNEFKFESSFGYHYNESNYLVGDNWITGTQRSQWGDLSLVKSINDHWSWGGFAGFNSSLYDNLKIRVALFPGIEYNLFPYSESTKNQFRFNYKLGGHSNQYFNTTIFNQTHEFLGIQEMSMEAKFQKKWGSIESSISFSHYLHDISLNATNFWASLNLRVAKGLSLNFSGWLGLIHNQINLPNEDASQEDILLRQRQLQTGYRYWGNVGISYTFGSIYNSIVNPRFGN